MRPALVSAAATLLAAAAAAAPATAGTYAGWIGAPGAGNAMVVATDAAGTRVRTVAVAFDSRCADGRVFAFHRRLAVGHRLRALRNAGGRLDARFQGRARDGATVFAERAVLRGRFLRHTARGTLRMTTDVLRRRTGEVVTTCASPRLQWHLQRGRGRVYGGVTTQDEPVALLLSRDRSTVAQLTFGWHTSCASGAAVDIPGHVAGLPLLDGLFADFRVFSDPDGGALGVQLWGRLGPRTARGAVSLAITTPAGDTCLADGFAWSAHSG